MANTPYTKRKKQMQNGKPVKKARVSKKKMEAMEENAEKMAEVLDDDDLKELEGRDFSSLIKQVQTEYELAWWFIKPKWDEWALRLKLYNNQKRDKEAVGDNTLFTIFQTVLAALYNDQLGVQFAWREVGDQEVCETLDLTAEFDYEEMGKDVLDYEWDFEACFFGRGLMALMEFDRETMVPVGEIWNVMTVLRDPAATSVNGDMKGRGRAKFLGREVRMTKNEMKELGTYFNYKKLKKSGTSTRSLIDENMRAVAEAAGLSDMSKFSEVEGENETHRLLEWFTMYKGKRVFVTLADDMKSVVRYVELDNKDIPIIDRVIYPVPQSWDGVSIPDLIEDKQRARAVAQNLSLKTVKAGLHPMYLFDETKIKNKSDLNFDFNKFIGVQGNPTGAVQEMRTAQVKADVQWIMQVLSEGAERATATPAIQQGAQPTEDNTATRDALINQKVDTRYSLSARIFGWSERRFWKQWYRLYKEHFKDGIDEKTLRITGALGAKVRPLTRENLIANTDPDVKIESRIISEERRFNELQKFKGFMEFAATDPNANLRFGLRYMAKLMGLKRDLIDHFLPPTIEEMRAEEENQAMRTNPDEPVEVLPTDDHMAHLEIHNKMEDVPAKFAHINAHKRAMLLERVRPDLFPPTPTDANNGVDAGRMPQQGANRPVTTGGFTGRAIPTA